jgi:hypothetical protein
VLNRLTDQLAWITGCERLARPVGMLDAEQPNPARFVFGDRRVRDVHPGWVQ